MSHSRQYRRILEPLTSHGSGSGGRRAARRIHSADIDLGSTVTRLRNKWNGSSRCQRMIRILKYEKASGSAKCQTGVGVGGYVAVVINPLRQIPRSSTEYEERRENGGEVEEGKELVSKNVSSSNVMELWRKDKKIQREKRDSFSADG